MLIDEQERDERLGMLASKWITSLDALVMDDGAERYELVASEAENPEEICIAEETGALIRKVVGGRSEDELGHLDYETLEWLGHRLQTEGLVSSITVTREERKRLRDPQRVTGVTVEAGKSWGGRKKRREKLADNYHGRPSRKPKKRWERAEWEVAA